MPNKQFVKFKLDKFEFCIDIFKIDIIINTQEIFPIPDCPDYVEGLINIRGSVVTIYNLRKRFNMKNKKFDSDTKFILTYIDDLLVGFPVDLVTEIIKVNESDINNTPEFVTSLDKKYLEGVIDQDNKIIMIIKFKEVLSSEEIINITKITKDGIPKNKKPYKKK